MNRGWWAVGGGRLVVGGWWLAVVAFMALTVATRAIPLPRVDLPLPAHAVLTHGEDADQAKQCLDGRKGYLFYNPDTRRAAVVCWLGDRWGIVILCAVTMSVITAFVCKKLKDAEHMKKYFERQGYR